MSDRRTFWKLIGKRVRDVLISSDETVIAFVTEAGERIAYAGDPGCSCTSVWIEHIAGIEAVLGQVIIAVEDKGWTEKPYEDEEGFEEGCVWTLSTAQGRCDIEVRNAGPGCYYSGEFVPAALFDVNDAKRVSADF